ncbi:MAG: hypothetical protein JXR07_04580 [Reichenbachiella sp.]
MKNGRAAIVSILIIGTSVLLLSLYDNYHSKYNLTPWLSTSPVYFLNKAESELRKKHLFNAKSYIEKAIYCMHTIDEYALGESKEYVDVSVNRLKNLIVKIDQRMSPQEELQYAYFQAVNTVAYSELIISEKEFQIGKRHESLKLLKTVLSLLNDSMEYQISSSDVKSAELRIIEQVSELITHLEQRKVLDANQCDIVKVELQNLLNTLI